MKHMLVTGTEKFEVLLFSTKWVSVSYGCENTQCSIGFNLLVLVMAESWGLALS